MSAEQKTPFTVAAYLTAKLIEIGIERVPKINELGCRYSGDSGFMMVCQELSSIFRAKSNAVVFVMSNHGYEHDLAPQLRRLAEPPPVPRRYGRAESVINAVGNHGLL
jgi:hypothetical protein